MNYSSVIAGCRIIEAGDPEFPSRLQRLPPESRPDRLFVAGEIPKPPAVAIVGTRSPDAHGIALAKRLARECSIRNIPVISGGALGIDRTAHCGCIDSGGKTIVVMAAGLKNPHPPGCTDLFVKAVESGGCLITDQPPSIPTQRFLFLQRNRLIAALAECVIVVQARFRSGALSTASWASACRVDLYAVAGSPLNPLYGGTNKLIRKGKAKIMVSVDSFFSEISPHFQANIPASPAAPSPQRKPQNVSILEKNELKVMKLVGTEPLSIDEIAAYFDVEIKEISKIIFDLEMKGFLCMSDPGRYVAAPEALSGKNFLVPDENW